MTKEWFIQKYVETRDNLSRLEKEIEGHQNNKDLISNDPIILENLKKETLLEIEKLNNLREYERKIFNY
jgi:hypothetical protein